MNDADYALEQPVALTCPDCGGALRMDGRGAFIHVRCHIGHQLSGRTLSLAQFSAFEHTLASALRRLAERIELCRIQAAALRGQDPTAARRWEEARRDCESQIETLRTLLTREWMHPESEESALDIDRPDLPADEEDAR